MRPQLDTLIISDSYQMEQIFRCSNIENQGIDSEKEILLPKMKLMKLQNLPRLVNVCQGFKLQTWEFCTVEVHDCPRLVPIMSAIIDWTKEGLERKYVLKDSQLNNNKAFNRSLPILYAGELDTQRPRVEHKWRVIGDDEREETNDSEMLRSKQQMLGGLVPTEVLSFQYLCSLEITHCKKLKFVFSMSTIVHNILPKLTSLSLFDCEELEEIIAENEEHQILSNVQVQ
ncbi:uncharacterized protein LOC114729031 [Neltuma alba]|uniref:uncharacterized protein LOC114729031 n=1 Tax=Neltuma alba TaxID=207710 RepID=UPI0010A3B5D4|nr:uncharacterized protein LOC114729031 [Prosopis alba]